MSELLIKDSTLMKPKELVIKKQKKIVALCDPNREIVDETGFKEFWLEIKQVLQLN
jgi:hypothetical protein